MLSNIKAGTYFFFGGCTIFGMLWAFFLMPGSCSFLSSVSLLTNSFSFSLKETKGVTLEGMDEIFGYDPSKRITPRTTYPGYPAGSPDSRPTEDDDMDIEKKAVSIEHVDYTTK
jgi:hypothetical protein